MSEGCPAVMAASPMGNGRPERVGWSLNGSQSVKRWRINVRCIYAHVHLGNLHFEHWPKQAIVHHELAVAIGELFFARE